MKMFQYDEIDRSVVAQCEADFARRLYDIAESVGHTEGLRICTLTGPTCSGKTTAAAMLVSRLAGLGKRAHVVSVDDFYHDTDYLHRLSAQKGLSHIDYDSVDTIDLATLRHFTEEILDGTAVHAPIFDFRQGKRIGYREWEIGRTDIVLFEGIQSGYPEVKALFAEHSFASIAIMPQTPLAIDDYVFEPNEIRLLRRIVRDYHFRNVSAALTLRMWDGVRRNEEAHIFPYIGACDHHLDSTMPYELCVLRPFLEKILGELTADDPHRSWADSLLSRLRGIPEIPASWIAPDSLYREFI